MTSNYTHTNLSYVSVVNDTLDEQNFDEVTIAITGILTVIGLLAALLNLGIIMTFITHPRLINPFTIHILNLSSIEFLSAITIVPSNAYNYFQGTWLPARTTCNFYVYIAWTVTSLGLSQHFIICTDRFLAVQAPIWYRQRKSVRSGILMTFMAFLWSQAWFLPMFLIDRLSGIPDNGPCHVDIRGQFVYSIVVQTTLYHVQEAFIYLTYPYIIVRVWLRRRTRIRTELSGKRSFLGNPFS